MQTNKQTDFANQGDTISRQAAIYAFTHKWDGMVTSVFDVINSLPSAQPDVPDINVGDMISRQVAIDAVVAWTVEDRPDIEMPTDLVGRIKALPSAQPEREYTMEEFMYGQDMGNPEDGSL